MSSAVARASRPWPALLMLVAVIGAQYIGWTLVLQIMAGSVLGLAPIAFLFREFEREDEEGFDDEAIGDC